MRQITLILLLLQIALFTHAQLPNGTVAPDFTATDIDGNTQNLYDYLDNGKTCILSFNTTWAGPVWSYHQTNALQDVYDAYGPSGTDEVMVLFIECDSTTTLQDLQGIPSTNGSTQGDYTANTAFPIIDNHTIGDLYSINAYPTILTICQDKLVEERGQASYQDHIDFIDNDCPYLTGVNNVSIHEFIVNDEICNIDSAITLIQNLGSANLTSAEFILTVNGSEVDTLSYSGNLPPFQIDTIFFQSNYTTVFENDFEIYAYAPNGLTDDDTTNNAASRSYLFENYGYLNELILDINTDQYGPETYWVLYDGAGTIHYEGGNTDLTISDAGTGISPNTTTGYAANSSYLETLNLQVLPEGCYKLVIIDAYGDGICCGYGNGGITISNNYGEVIETLYDFGAQYDLSFIIERGDFEIYTYPYLDVNNNSFYDASVDIILQNQYFECDTTLAYYLLPDGEGRFYTDSIDTFDIAYLDNPIWDAAPATQTVITNPPDSVYALYYIMTPDSIFDSVELDISSSITRCFQETNFWVTVNNLGTTFADGMVAFTYSDSMSYFSTSPSPDSIVNQTVYFSYDSLPPSYSEQFIVTLTMPSFAFMGDTMHVSATIDSDPNSQFDYSSELVCAYDPNDKQVSPLGDANGNLNIETDTTLTYTIRFQNTGNDTAFNIIVRDTLSEMLNLSSFQFITSSHSPVISLDPQKRVAEFNFQNILLPDSGINQLGSNGFIKFKIDVVDNIQWNDFVQNKAEIYFDFNPAIITNTVSSVYKITTDIQEATQYAFKIYPNPSQGLVNLESDFLFEKIEVINLQGKTLKTFNGWQNQIDLSALNKGAYLIKLINGKEYISKKVMLTK